MKKLTKWLTSNDYAHEVQRLTNGGQCVFIKLHQIGRAAENTLMGHLSRAKLRFEYAGYYSWIRIDF